jgi:hypothetical protein
MRYVGSNNTGAILGTYPAGTSPSALAIDSSNNVWVISSSNSTVTKILG